MVSEKRGEKEAALEAPPFDRDVLEAILSRVPLIDLALASHVSKRWEGAVFSSLRYLNVPKPWLVIHSQSTRSYAATSRAYDPRSDLWMKIESRPSMKHEAALRSSISNLLYELSPAKLSFSLDPLHLTWHHVDPPKVWRTDPIIAVVCSRIIVAGGSCDFEDDPLAVEMYDLDSALWIPCKSIPADLKGSSASTWLSATSDGRRLLVTEKHSGVTHTFDPNTNSWSGPFDIRPSQRVFYSIIVFADNCLILIGLTGDTDNLKALKLWRVNPVTLECEEEVGEMPMTLLDDLERESYPLASIGACVAGKFLYVYNPSNLGVVLCELVDGGCLWRSIPVAADMGESFSDRMVFTCAEVSLDDVEGALGSTNHVRFSPLLVNGRAV